MADEHNNDDKANSEDQPREGFRLAAPGGRLDDLAIPERSEVQQAEQMIPEKESKLRDPGGTTWRGFEEEEEDEDPDVTFGKKEIPEDELDMTPMVDVTFLLLIFFMVTASFTLVKSIQNPPAAISEPSTTVIEDPEDEDDYVQVTIDQNNSYYVTSRDADEEEAPSDREMRAQMKDAKDITGCSRLIIKAHVDSTHNKVVNVWDAGIAFGMQQIEMETIDFDY